MFWAVLCKFWKKISGQFFRKIEKFKIWVLKERKANGEATETLFCALSPRVSILQPITFARKSKIFEKWLRNVQNPPLTRKKSFFRRKNAFKKSGHNPRKMQIQILHLTVTGLGFFRGKKMATVDSFLSQKNTPASQKTALKKAWHWQRRIQNVILYLTEWIVYEIL